MNESNNFEEKQKANNDAIEEILNSVERLHGAHAKDVVSTMVNLNKSVLASIALFVSSKADRASVSHILNLHAESQGECLYTLLAQYNEKDRSSITEFVKSLIARDTEFVKREMFNVN